MKQNIMLVGLGHHARRIYYPVLESLSNNYNFLVVDRTDQEHSIRSFLSDKPFQPVELLLINNFLQEGDLPDSIIQKLDSAIKEYNIKGVIISTDPLYHRHYAKWALERNLSILMDKPISVHKNISTDAKQAEKLLEDYDQLNELYQKQKGNILFSIVSQRRFHKGFQRIKQQIGEVFERTNCPITSIQISHSDGQWRLPSEMIDIDYHSYNLGFGKCSHSGYHFLDIITFLFESTIDKNKQINNAEICATFVRPLDFITQFNLKDYQNIFKDFNQYNKYSNEDYFSKMKAFGEVDAFVNIAFKHDDKIITLCSINLCHNSFSQRGNLIPNRDLYKGNGRIRHETYTIQQGPFQCIQITSFQSREVEKDKKPKYSAGGEYHFDIHTFRNDKIIKDWKNYEKISIRDLQKNEMREFSRGHQEDARRYATLEFLEFLEGKRKSDYVSDFTKHRDSVKLMCGIYTSGSRRFNNENPVVKIKW